MSEARPVGGGTSAPTVLRMILGRQSTDPAGPALIYTPEEIGAFVTGVKNGLAEHMTAPEPSGSRTATPRAQLQAAQVAKAAQAAPSST